MIARVRKVINVILANGQPRSDFTDSRIGGGMFFSGDNREPLNVGFECVYDFKNFFVSGGKGARRFNTKALSLVDSGYKVVTGYEGLAIGGVEAYITMFQKGAKHAKAEENRRT